MKNRQKIVLTGGHAGTTALSVIQEIEGNKDLDWKLFWIGPKIAMEGKKTLTLEAKIFPEMKTIFLPLISGRLQLKWTIWTIPSIFKIPIGFMQAFIYLIRIKPDLILSFGGFSAVPVVIVGFLLDVPIIIHEQTNVVGRANKLSSYFATKIALAREESRKYFPWEKCVLIGQPLLSQISKLNPKSQIGNPPIIYITGGSRGSKTLNAAVDKILVELIKSYIVIHQTGEEDFDYFLQKRADLNNYHYEVYSFIDPRKLDSIYKRADIVICRGGANTVAEIIYLARPSIIVPITLSYKNEQLENAHFAQKYGISIIITENNLTASLLLKKINFLAKNWMTLVRMNRKDLIDEKASKKMVNLIFDTLRL